MTRRFGGLVDRPGFGRTLGLLVVLAGLPATAFGQLVPPPTEAPAATPTVTPMVLPGEATQGVRDAALERRDAAERARAQAEQERAAMQDLPNLPYESLVKRDEAGHIIALPGNPHVLALNVNPLMDDSTVERVQGVIAERRDKVERMVIQNVDLVQQVLDGAVDQANIEDRASIARLIEIVRPFQEMGHLTEDLKAQGYLSTQQYGFNWKIVREYEQARTQDMMASAASNTDPNATNPQTLVTRHIMSEILREPMLTYDALVLEGAGRIDDAMGSITPASDKQAQAATLVSQIKAASDDETRLARARELTNLLDSAQKGQFLQNVVNTR